ncbi:MAG: GNAT family N-acetyltransferase, partial [Qipengyuania vulgaris]
MSALTIRLEKLSDHARIGVVTDAAFAEVDHSDGNEVQIVEKLRTDGDLTLSLVAEDGERIIGHV